MSMPQASFVLLTMARSGAVAEGHQELYLTWAPSFVLGEVCVVLGSYFFSRAACKSWRIAWLQDQLHRSHLEEVCLPLSLQVHECALMQPADVRGSIATR